eukprot:maker-scaffold_5-snap-gene-18.52-mRNA-1 protein AED:0.00 eAED:0.00 QI:56/1/1/1/1/1/3/418/409
MEKNKLATSAKIVFNTTLGSIEVELWAKEAPQTSKVLLKLIKSGYFDGTRFHRIVPKSLAQFGEREELDMDKYETKISKSLCSFSEVNRKLTFSHRGILAVAAEQKDILNSNTKEEILLRNQLFFTLEEAEWLNYKHIILGKIVGDSYYNLLKVNETELFDKETMPRIISGEIIFHPFKKLDLKPLHGLFTKQKAVPVLDEPKRKKGSSNKKVLSIPVGERKVEQDKIQNKTEEQKAELDKIEAEEQLLSENFRKMVRKREKNMRKETEIKPIHKVVEKDVKDMNYFERRNFLLEKQKREKKSRNRQRQDETLSKLKVFSQRMENVKKKVKAKRKLSIEDQNEKRYKGGIGKNITQLDKEKEMEGEVRDEDWMNAKLSWRRHLDDDHRLELSADDYVLTDSRKKKQKKI